MRNPLKAHGFERRLLVFFLLLSVTPAVLIAIFGTHYFLGPVERVSSPALRESFSNSMEIARQLSTKFEVDASEASITLAEEFARGGLARGGEATCRALEVSTKRCRADFSALYTLDGTSWTLLASYPHDLERVDKVLAEGDIPPGTGPQKVALSDQDVIAAAVRLGDDRLLVAGFTLDAGMTERMRKTGEDLSLYGSASRWVSTMRVYIIVIFSAIVAITAISSTVVSRLLARRISQPIQELALATDRIAQGDLTHRVRVKARDEINSLVSSFNNMTQELEENKKNLIAMAKRQAQVARDFEIAREVQQNLFPKTLPEEKGWEFAATCRPARAVGGDYYDIFEAASGKVLFAQGDVSGKGLGASLVMASVHAVVRSWAGALQHEPSKLIEELNAYLMSSSAPETFVSLFLGVLDCPQGRISYVNCGHPPAVARRSSTGSLEQLSVGGPVLGVMVGNHYEAGEFTLKKGDSLVLVSDGVTEAVNPKDEMFDIDRLFTTVSRPDDEQSAKAMMDNIIRAVDTFTEGSEQADDMSILVLRSRTAEKQASAGEA